MAKRVIPLGPHHHGPFRAEEHVPLSAADESLHFPLLHVVC